MLLHLSDLHFGTEKWDCLNAIQQFCQQHRPEAVVVSGDLTQRATFSQFYACRQFLERLALPYLVVPGNHDIPLYNVWTRWFSTFARYQLFFGELENTLETEHFYVVGVNSMRRRAHTKGHISLEQIQSVYQKLKAAPEHKIKLVAFHQPFYALKHEAGYKDCPVLGKIALEQWGQTGLLGVLHGHLHQVAVHDLNQIFQLGFTHPIYDIHAGTASSRRLRYGLSNSFNVILDNGTIEHYWFDEVSRRFTREPPVKLSQKFN